MKKRICVNLFFVLLLPLSVFAQRPAPSFDALTEVRSMDPEYNQLNLRLNFDSLQLSEDAEIKLLHIYAIDDLGNKLESTGRTSEFKAPENFFAYLELPLRQASQLQKVHMSYRIFSPSEANNSRPKVTGFIGKPYRNLLADHYEDINFMLVDSLDFRRRWSDLIADDVSISTLESRRSKEPLAPSRTAYFLFEDPNGRIADIRILDAQGKPVKTWRSLFDSSNAPIRCWDLNAESEMQADWILEVIVRNDAAMTDHVIELSDIKLY